MNAQHGYTTATQQNEPRADYYWVNEEEPHYKRRKQILAAHPEVKELFGVNPRLKYTTVALVVVQLGIALYAHKLPWIPFILVSYFIGATIAQALFLAVHEITHNFAFNLKRNNNLLAFIANLPIVAPFAMSFQIYHGIHHWEQGVHGADTDIPTEGEAKLFKGIVGKVLWFVNQIVFYAFRPIFVKPITITKWQVYNIIFQVTAMAIFLPFAGWAGLGYLLLSLLLAGSLHPTAGHFISEHYVMHEGQETYSYYGPLNKITFNVGYHNEHHDFPMIPGSRLPALKKMAPEFYDNLHSYNSWTKVIFDFILRKDINLYSRTKRTEKVQKNKGRKATQAV